MLPWFQAAAAEVHGPAVLFADNRLRWQFRYSGSGITREDILDFAGSLKARHTFVDTPQRVPWLIFNEQPSERDFLMAKLRWS